MIPPLPSNLGFIYVAVPLLEWISAPKVDTPVDPAPAAQAGEGGERAEGPACPATDLRLVFKGYAWQPQAQWYPFVNPGWDHFVDNDADEIHERAIQQERERAQQAAQQAAQLARPATGKPGKDD